MGNILAPPRPPVRKYAAPNSKTSVDDKMWRRDGLHWDDQQSRHCTIMNINSAFGPSPSTNSDIVSWYRYEMHVFERICAIIRTREAQLNEQRVPELRGFYHHYKFTLDSTLNIERSTREIIDRLKLRFGTSERHHNERGPRIVWEGNTCHIYHIPHHILHRDSDHFIPTNDIVIQERFKRILDWEFHELQRHLNGNNKQIPKDVHFEYDGPSIEDKVAILNEAKEWEKMWNASHMHQSSRVSSAHEKVHAPTIVKGVLQPHMVDTKHSEGLPAHEHRGKEQIRFNETTKKKWAIARQNLKALTALQVNRHEMAASAERRKKLMELDPQFNMYTDTNHSDFDPEIHLSGDLKA